MQKEIVTEVQAVLNEIGRRFADKRISFWQVEAAAGQDGGVALTGAVLDSAAYGVLAGELPEGFPGVCFDASGVQILRSATPGFARVATNLTGLYAQPSFLAEMSSQLLYGVPLEVLAPPPSPPGGGDAPAASRGEVPPRWSFVRQEDGYLGWAYRPYLAAGAPEMAVTHLACEPESVLCGAHDPGGPIAGRLLGGTGVQVTAEEGGWARIGWDLAADGSRAAWVEARALRALSALPADAASRRQQMVEDAAGFVGVPYLWGGCTAYGIDCSGLAQLVHRLAGITIPRDADMQFSAGQPVEPPGEPGDLLFFAEGGPGHPITHVAISLGRWRMIHSSRSRNGVYVDDLRALPDRLEEFAGARTFVGE